MTTKEIGDLGESRAVKYLLDNKHKIIDRNWKTKWCEIDIVSKKNNKIYFVEVKYRKNDAYGDGLDAITSQKLKQMTLSAEFWVNYHNWSRDYALAVVSVTPNSIIYIEI